MMFVLQLDSRGVVMGGRGGKLLKYVWRGYLRSKVWKQEGNGAGLKPGASYGITTQRQTQ